MRNVRRHYQHFLVCLPSLLPLLWWQVSHYAHQHLSCSLGKSGSLACLRHSSVWQEWVGHGLFLGQLLFWVSIPLAAIILFEIRVHVGKQPQPDAARRNSQDDDE